MKYVSGYSGLAGRACVWLAGSEPCTALPGRAVASYVHVRVRVLVRAGEKRAAIGWAFCVDWEGAGRMGPRMGGRGRGMMPGMGMPMGMGMPPRMGMGMPPRMGMPYAMNRMYFSRGW